MPDSSRQEIKLFYCYAREDKTLRDELEKHLSSLKRLYALRTWHDREILPGQEWEQIIENSLNTAHLILLLISPDFMNSDYAYGKEMQRALERHEQGTCKVLPIILRPTFLDGAPFTQLQMLPTDAKPITRWSDRDEAFNDVVKQINDVLKDLLLSLKSKEDWLNEGITYRNHKRYEFALEAFEQALHRDPNYLEAYQEKGKTLFELEHYDNALEVFEEALRLNPNVVALVIAKGQTLNALKHCEDAFATFEKAIRLDPTNADAYIGRDKVLEKMGISREAQEELAHQLARARQKFADSQKQVEYLESQLAAQHSEFQQLRDQLSKTHQQLEAQLTETGSLPAGQLQERNLALVVITETNPGIRRKKPNEDSLFAAQGVRRFSSQQFGLFVVADGRGSHTSGQDASSTAIQNIINFMLPNLVVGSDLNDEAYKALLVKGVEEANFAVHQRNLQVRADMGATMTAAIIIGSTAYVANVGDSRTYLYREPEGLRQITHDHSVVASLVEAGIIKPDDIYTHPKRNEIYRSLGGKPGVDVDTFIQPLQPNDKLLLCSKGLWKMVRDPNIQQIVRYSIPNLNQIGRNLVQAALVVGGEENISVIVVSITEEAGQPAITGLHLHAKPDTVAVPDLAGW